MLDIPVFHDDDGTAVVCTAALINAARETGTDLKGSVIGQIGLGPPGHAIGLMMMHLTGNAVYGADYEVKMLSIVKRQGA